MSLSGDKKEISLQLIGPKGIPEILLYRGPLPQRCNGALEKS